MADAFHEAKRIKLLDLIRRACANSTHAEVADAIARDWCPLYKVLPDGSIDVAITEPAHG